ncbi:dockerin type I domain-containing protein, partial [Hungatella sp.]
MKRAAACLLALCLVVQGPASLMTSFADFGQRGVASPSNSVSASPSDAWKESDSDSKNGELKVEIRGVLPVQKAAEWELFLTKDEELTDQGSVQYEAVESAGVYSSGSYTFTDLPKGKYQLQVKAVNGGYEDYIQKNISINGDRASILLLNDYPDKYGYAGDKMPGVIRMGDVNGDGTIDSDDMEAFIDAIDEADGNFADSRFDFNGDGQIDLVDLQYFTIFYKNKSNTKATVTRQALVDTAAVVASSSNASFSEETLKEVFAGNDSEALTLTAETAITPETPIEITADLGQSLKAEGFTIQPVTGSGNTIKDGWVTVELEGEEKPVVFRIENGVAERQTGTR